MNNTTPLPDEMYAALLERDASYDGVFYACVKTTGIFCRPVCHARNPKRKNVEFVSSTRDAILRGFRPCKFCDPVNNGNSHPGWVEDLMDRVHHANGVRLADQDLRELGIDPIRSRRYCQRYFGMTFQAWQRALRLGLATAQLRSGDGVLPVGLDSGFSSASGFRGAFAQLFGKPPGQIQDVECLVAKWLETPLGPMIAAASSKGVCLLEFVDRRAIENQIKTLCKRFDAVIVPGENEHLTTLQRELSEYFAGRLTRFATPLELRGTDFQMNVWRRLSSIPYAETRSYSQIASDIGCPSGRRAVGRANGDNRIAILVSCHRVVRADGNLCGYGGGLWRKKWLLQLEQDNVN